MSYLLPHLHTGYAVDQAILSEEDRVVIIRFGHDWDPGCMQVRRGLGGPGWQLHAARMPRGRCLPTQLLGNIAAGAGGCAQSCVHIHIVCTPQMDEILASTAEQMKNFAVTYLVSRRSCSSTAPCRKESLH